MGGVKGTRYLLPIDFCNIKTQKMSKFKMCKKLFFEKAGDNKHITRTCLYNFDPLKPHFYIAKLGLKGVYIIFLISAQRHRLWVLVRTASAQPTIYVLSRNVENIRIFSDFFYFLVVKFSVYLNRRVFVMVLQTEQQP